jgi:hypothetical protein
MRLIRSALAAFFAWAGSGLRNLSVWIGGESVSSTGMAAACRYSLPDDDATHEHKDR